MKTLVLTQRHVARLVDLRTAIRIVRESFKAMARGDAVMPPKLYLPLPHESDPSTRPSASSGLAQGRPERGEAESMGDFRAMPAFLRRPAAAGVKWVNVHPRNRTRGLPTVMAVIIINDPATGFPLAVMDGLLITKLRTAAAAAVAAQALARRESRVAALIGCGAQAETLLLALAELFALTHVKVWGYFQGEARRFCQAVRRALPRVVLEPCATIERSVREVDIVMTVTPSRRPLIKRSWLSPGTHLNAIGADAPGKQELDPRILREATIVVDDREQAIHAGELNVPIRRGQLSPRHIHATLGEVLIGRRPGRRTKHELTVFDSTGLAVHDVALGADVVRHAHRRGMGHSLTLFV